MDKYLHIRFQALGDPTRLSVVQQLLRGPASVSELAKPHKMALPPFTKHLHVLEKAGLITSEKNGRIRTCTIDPRAFADMDRWFSDRRRLWTGRLGRLAKHLCTDPED
ncbi:MAG: winged helix-turn-helix transcriptional regulator [Proteobacteria bacterium]|nr:winged helix-turn-helix transcriptional regulator [Pseudomonadota bacterium]